jgi:chemotaxis protein methyltransferase CheR
MLHTHRPAPEPKDTGAACTITEQEFQAFRELIHQETGIALAPSRVALVSARLMRRLRALKLHSFGEYYDLVREDTSGDELRQMVNCITTNKTSFFREAHHFELLRNRVLLEAEQRARIGRARKLRIWSAGCSTGEEPYTIAMTLHEHFKHSAGWDIRILASDIDTDVLGRAERGVYRHDDLDDVPKDLVHRHFLRGTASHAGSVQVKPSLREMIAFRRINLIAEPWPLKASFDVIFCRNVIIYFNRETQRRLLERFAKHLRPSGYLFLGHSENVHGITDQFEPIGATVYQLRRAEADTPSIARPTVAIMIGDVRTSVKPVTYRTVLGSCIAACLFDPVLSIGGINHFLLPEGDADSCPNRYGVNAMPALIRELVGLGADRRRLKAKIFGAVESEMAGGCGAPPAQNVAFVRSFLEKERIPVVAERLGGRQPLEVLFEAHTGRALARALPARERKPGCHCSPDNPCVCGT